MSAPSPVGDDSPRRPDETSAVPDEVWDRFLHDTEERIRASAPREPSAVVRLAAAGPRLPRLPAPPAAHGPWRAAPGPGGRLRRALRSVLVVLVVSVLGLLTLNPALALSWAENAAGRARRAPADPFAGSPADYWADGADGIVVPPARAVGTMTRSQVADALRETKRYLVASDLDPRTLRGQWPSAAIGLIDPRDTAQTAALTRALRAPDAAHDPLRYVTRYNPAQIRLAGSVVKVRGAMTFTAGAEGSVEVRTDFSFVYPFTRAHGSPSQVTRSVVRRVVVVRMYDEGRAGAAPGKLWLARTSGYRFNTACDADDGYLHPRFAAAPGGTGRTTAPADPYDRRAPVAGLPYCQTASGT